MSDENANLRGNHEAQISLPNLQNTLRINKDCARPFYAAFVDELGGNKLLNKEIRKKIVARWAKITPLISENNLRQHLWNVEQKFYKATPPWEVPALINKITTTSMVLQEDILEADGQAARDLIKKSEAINNLNKTIAQVNKLTDQAAAPTFIIQTNVSEDSLMQEMNAVDVEVIEEEGNE
jgi:hypothetical protein